MPKTDVTPHRMINSPRTKPAIDPPWGNPKHSLSFRRLSCLSCLTALASFIRGSLQFTQFVASSSFFVPHFVQ